MLLLGGLIGWLSHRALLNDVNEISRTASAISKGNLSRRVATRGGSDELDNLAQTVNGMPSSSPHKTCNSRAKSAYAGKQSTRSIVPMRILRVW